MPHFSSPGRVLGFFCLALAAGCGSSASPPDGSCGVRGVCLLPAEPAAADGRVPPRRAWAGVQVQALRINSPHADYKSYVRTKADETGAFQIALNPGEYSLSAYDPELLRGKMSSPMHIRVEAGRFTEVVIDYDKLNVRDLPRR